MARVITDLHPDLQKKIEELIKLCDKNDLKIGISECLRTASEQDALYAQGRTKSGSIVTNIKGSTYSSMHQWGIAFDFYRNDGKGAFNDSDGFFTKIGEIGQKLGLEWGGDWVSIKDKPHFQLPNWGSTATKLKSIYSTPDKFIKTWKVSNLSVKLPSIINTKSNKEDIVWLQTQLNKVNRNYQISVDGAYGQKTRIALLMFADSKGWNWSTTWGYTAKEATIKSLARY